MSVYDTILERVHAKDRLRTPDDRSGKPFTIESIDLEGVSVRTSTGGRVRVSLFTFDTAVKFLGDHGCRGDRWLEVKDADFQMLLNMENDRVRAGSYVLAILAAAGLLDIDGSRPNKVRLR